MRGENWLAGDYTLPGALVKVANTSPFDVPVANSKWLASLHGFDWLRHICALSAQRGQRRRRFMCRTGYGAIRCGERSHAIGCYCTAVDELERRHADHFAGT